MADRLVHIAGWITVGPLAALGIVAAYVGGLGVMELWTTVDGPLLSTPAAVLVAASWHVAWLGAAGRHRAGGLVVLAWLISVSICRAGFAASRLESGALYWAVLLESTLLGLSWQLTPSVPWVDRLARWRRTRERVTAQIEIARGLIPWTKMVGHRLLFGESAIGPPTHFERFAAVVADVDVRLDTRLAGVVVPEEVRQSLLTAARDLATEAELASVEAALALEHRALNQAVAFRDRCAHLPDLTEDERDALARAGHRFLLEVATGKQWTTSSLDEEAA